MTEPHNMKLGPTGPRPPLKKFDFAHRHSWTMKDVSLDKNDYFDAAGFTSIEPLPFLHGKKWDEYALAFVLTLNPKYLRVTSGPTTMDSRMGRMTITVDDEGIIQNIDYEVAIGLPEGAECGEDMDRYLAGLPPIDWDDSKVIFSEDVLKDLIELEKRKNDA